MIAETHGNTSEAVTAATLGRRVVDVRREKGRIWNQRELAHTVEDISCNVDEFLYRGYHSSGPRFLRAVRGRFGVAFEHSAGDSVFIARDWIGEVPLHYQLTDESIVIGNLILDIQEFLGPEEYRYDYVRAVPHSHALIIDAAEHYVLGPHKRRSWKVRERRLYYDFNDDRLGVWNEDSEAGLQSCAKAVRDALEHAVKQRAAALPCGTQPAVLLSGGIDSLTVAYLVAMFVPRTVAYTLSVGEGGDDVQRAKEIAAALKLDLRIVPINGADAVASYEEAVRASEIYHLPNVYCAVGMLALAKTLKADGIQFAFCGEGVNEAVGDYHDWVVRDPRTGAPRTLQCVDFDRLGETAGRVRYVWGREDRGSRYNAHLGSGLAKHGISRMVKPMLLHGIELECPYLDQEVMRRLVAVPARRLEAIGGKPGFMARVFARDIQRGAIPRRFITESRKVRLQDASEFGDGGLTPALLAAGLDQHRTIEIFNELFGAHLDPRYESRRLSSSTSE